MMQITYSDSAKVKAQGFAPILDKVTPKRVKLAIRRCPKA
jgi:hypothetical protein